MARRYSGELWYSTIASAIVALHRATCFLFWGLFQPVIKGPRWKFKGQKNSIAYLAGYGFPKYSIWVLMALLRFATTHGFETIHIQAFVDTA